MKARIIILIVCISFIVFLTYTFTHKSSVVSPSPTLPVPTTAQIHTGATLTYQDVIYDYEFFTVNSLTHLKLLPNFETQTRGVNLATKNNCAYAINGGFYSTSNQPLGAFLSQDFKQLKPLTSKLFNGFFAYTNASATITTDFETAYTTLLQSGPLLINNGVPLPLAIQNDEHARRSVAAITDDNRVLFITFYIHDSIYNGPLLGDLPIILKQFAASQRISIAAALNLDGGSATYFKSPDIELPELTSIGSMFCLQK